MMGHRSEPHQNEIVDADLRADDGEHDDAKEEKEKCLSEKFRCCLILFSAFLLNIIVSEIQDNTIAMSLDGHTYTQFKTSLSTFETLTLLCAPFACASAEHFGFRRVAMFGSGLATIGISLTSLLSSEEETNFYSVLIGYAVCGGVATAIIHPLSIVIVGLSFEKFRATAIGLTLTGLHLRRGLGLPTMTHFITETGASWNVRVWCLTGLFTLSIFLPMTYPQKPKQNAKMAKLRTLRSSEDPSILEQLWELLTSPAYLIFCISISIMMTGCHQSWLSVYGNSHKDWDFLQRIIGVTFAISVIAFAILSNLFGHSLLIRNVVLTIAALVTGSSQHVFVHDHWAQITRAGIVGLQYGILGALSPIIIMNIVKERKFNMGFGLVQIFFLVGMRFNQVFKDIAHVGLLTYEGQSYVGGGLVLLAALMCYPLAHIQTWEENRKGKEEFRKSVQENVETYL